MRVSQISICHQQSPYSTQRKINRQIQCPPAQPVEDTSSVCFKGKFGAILGAVVGGAAVVATALVTVPAVACLAGGGALIGGMGLDMAEDAVNGKKDDED